MTEARYSVIYRGSLLEGYDRETAKNNLVTRFAMSGENAEKILGSRRMVLKKNLDKAEATEFGRSLQQAGLDVALAKSAPADAPATSGPPPPADTPPPGETTAGGAASPPAAAGPAPVPFEFHGTGGEYFKIWIVNVILSIITLGIYSPWAKVRRKQYLYGSTRLKGAGFDYLADPVKILKGRLIVVAVLVVQQIVAELIPAAGIVIGLAILVVLPWVIVRSLAFNARNSAIRNIRFAFHGTVGEAAKAYILWPILGALTLGIMSPYAYYKQKKFVVENSAYGKTRFTFHATPGDYYRIFLGLIIPLILGGLAVSLASAVIPPASIIFIAVLYLYGFAYFSVKTGNLLYNSMELGPHELESTMEIKDYLGIVVVNSIAVALTLGLFHPWAKVRTLRYRLQNLTLNAAGDLDGFVAAEQEEVSALGEEMGDFLDFDFGL